MPQGRRCLHRCLLGQRDCFLARISQSNLILNPLAHGIYLQAALSTDNVTASLCEKLAEQLPV